MKKENFLDDARKLESALQKKFSSVRVRFERGHLVIYSDDEKVARLTATGGGNYALSFHNHSGKWEPMPFSGTVEQLAGTIEETLGPYLQAYNL